MFKTLDIDYLIIFIIRIVAPTLDILQDHNIGRLLKYLDNFS